MPRNSLHTYGKTGAQFTQTISGLLASVASVHTPATGAAAIATLPLIVTEHAAHTSGDWNSLPSNADANFEASRLASQLARAAAGGQETYIFKVRAVNMVATALSL